MNKFDLIWRGIAISQLLLPLLLFFFKSHRSKGHLLYALWLCGLLGYLAAPLLIRQAGVGAGLFMLAALFATCVPLLFWLCCRAVFQDRYRLHYGVSGLLAAYILLAALMLPVITQLASHDISALYLQWFLPMSKATFVALGLYAILTGWRDDLIQSRRRLRATLLLLCGLYILIIVAVERLVQVEVIRTIEWINTFAIALLALVSNCILLAPTARFESWFQPRQSVIQPTQPVTVDAEMHSPPMSTEFPVPHKAQTLEIHHLSAESYSAQPSLDSQTKILERLDSMMKEQKIYREAGLTITELGAKLNLPDYRLRKIINERLGFRNFNDFLNHYRIQDAAERLTNPGEPITNIALDIGYRSLSTFNKAFRDRLGLTPTEYRQRHQGR